MFLQVSTNVCRITVYLKSEAAMQCHRRGLMKIDPDTRAMKFEKIAAHQAAAQGSEGFGEEAGGINKVTVSVTSMKMLGS